MKPIIKINNSLVNIEADKIEINGIFWLALASLIILGLYSELPKQKRFNLRRRFRSYYR